MKSVGPAESNLDIAIVLLLSRSSLRYCVGVGRLARLIDLAIEKRRRKGARWPSIDALSKRASTRRISSVAVITLNKRGVLALSTRDDLMIRPSVTWREILGALRYDLRHLDIRQCLLVWRYGELLLPFTLLILFKLCCLASLCVQTIGIH